MDMLARKVLFRVSASSPVHMWRIYGLYLGNNGKKHGYFFKSILLSLPRYGGERTSLDLYLQNFIFLMGYCHEAGDTSDQD